LTRGAEPGYHSPAPGRSARPAGDAAPREPEAAPTRTILIERRAGPTRSARASPGRRRPIRIAVHAAALGAVLAGCARSRPNVLLITVDTLRADRLGCYGGTAAPTPHVDRLASEGLVFDNAACPMPQTRPSHFSIMTSLYPRQHGVVNNRIALPETLVTMPEVFRAAGYRTGGFVAVKLLGRDSGGAQGFGTFLAPTEQAQWPADRVVPRAVEWIDAPDGEGRPFFLWLHLFDPHMPYAPPPPFRPPADGPIAEELPIVSWEALRTVAREQGGALSRAVLDRALALYAGEIAYTDRWIGELLSALDERGLTDRTAIAFTADHGECFDHGIYFDHTSCLYDGAVRVPLILRYPGRVPAGERRAVQVENLDIAPTLFALAGVAAPPSFGGRALLGAAGEGAAFVEHPLLHEGGADYRSLRSEILGSVAGEPLRPTVGDEDLVGVRTPSWKYLRSGDREELYDVRSDPGETRNVAARNPAAVRRLEARLQAWLDAHPLKVADESKISEELRETLRSLGYLQ
jgi:arylsulfatase A-like enzyme